MAGLSRYVNEHRSINEVNAVITSLYVPNKEESKKQWSEVILIKFCWIRRNHSLLPGSTQRVPWKWLWFSSKMEACFLY